jgi:ribosomal protein S18 acetylase RimI-like enzyme
VALSDLTADHRLEVMSSDVESARFGYRFGRCTIPTASPATPTDIARAIEDHDAEITVLRYPADRVTWFDHLARELGGHVLIHADTLVYWELAVGSGSPPAAIDGIGTTSPIDAEMIGTLTARVFEGYSNHYTANPLLSAMAAEAGYQEWAMRTPLQNALVLELDGSPVGIATTEPTAAHIEILLAGVVPEQRGRGLYQHLLRDVESRARQQALESVVISTQAHNTAVQRAWARYGFLPLAAFTTLHVIRASTWAPDRD